MLRERKKKTWSVKVNISGGRYRCVCYQKMAIQKYPSKLLFINFIQRNPNFIDKSICKHLFFGKQQHHEEHIWKLKFNLLFEYCRWLTRSIKSKIIRIRTTHWIYQYIQKNGIFSIKPVLIHHFASCYCNNEIAHKFI